MVEIGRRREYTEGLEGRERRACGMIVPSRAGPVQFHACRGESERGEGGFKRRLKGGRGPWRTRGWVGARGDDDGRRADGILRSVQYVPICRHVLSIPPGTLLLHAVQYSYLYSELCEINPPCVRRRVRFFSMHFTAFFCSLSLSFTSYFSVMALRNFKCSTIRFS